MWCGRNSELLNGIFIFILTIASTWSTTYEILTIQPESSEVLRNINDTYFVTCSSQNDEKLNWLNPRNETINNYKGRIHTEERESSEGNRSLALVFTQLLQTDHGIYTCSVEDRRITKSFSLLINEPIIFVDTPIIQSANETSDATIKCEVSGHPTPIVSWSFNGQLIDFNDDKKYIKLGDGLLVKHVIRTDSGEYTCRAFQVSQTFTDLQDKTIKLNVEHKPLVLHEKAKIVYGFVNGQVNLTCKVHAEPIANFKWYKDEKKLSPSKYTFHNGDNFSILGLIIYNQSYFGDYVCKASNYLGTVQQLITLKYHPKPYIPADFTLRGINSETLDIKIMPSNKTSLSELKGFRIQYIPNAEFTKFRNWEKSVQIDFKHPNDVFLLRHLLPSTTYLVRVAAGNIAGFSDFTDHKEFKTSMRDPETSSSNKLPINLLALNLNVFLYAFKILSM